MGLESDSEVELLARIAMLSGRLEVARIQCAALEQASQRCTSKRNDGYSDEDHGGWPLSFPAAVHRLITAWEAVVQLDSAGVESHVSDSCRGVTADRDEEDDALPLDRLVDGVPSQSSATGMGQQGMSLRGAAFGGPWLPRVFAGPCWGEAVERRGGAWTQADPRPGSSASLSENQKLDLTKDSAAESSPEQHLQAKLGGCRRDRSRYFEQYLEVRELLAAAEDRRHGGSMNASSSSAPAVTHRDRVVADRTVLAPPAAPRALTPRGARPLPPLAPLVPPSQSGQRRVSRRGASARQPLTARSGRRWDQFWEELTSSDPALPAFSAQASDIGTDRQRSGLPCPRDPLGTGGCSQTDNLGAGGTRSGGRSHSGNMFLRAHLEDRALIDRRLCFWEGETLRLCAREQGLRARVRALEKEQALRCKLDRITFEVLALFSLRLNRDRRTEPMQ